jgi:hypothetical protein
LAEYFLRDDSMRLDSRCVLFEQQAVLFVRLVPIEGVEGIEVPIPFAEPIERQLPGCALPDEIVMNGKLVQQIGLGLEHLHVLGANG